MDRIVSLTLIQALVVTLVEEKVISVKVARRIFSDSIAALEEIDEGDQIVAEAIEYLRHLLSVYMDA